MLMVLTFNPFTRKVFNENKLHYSILESFLIKLQEYVIKNREFYLKKLM